DPGVEFPTADAPAPAFPLVAPRGPGFVARFTEAMDGELRAGGHSASLAELRARGVARPSASEPGAFELDIPDAARVLVRAGKSAFAIARVDRPRPQAAPLWRAVESRALAFV